ncbi:MAG: hypothetical protein SGI74_12770 [Oligoflexia bacterium]|nr:hypothetical protein [Oligoflexia bacterium]
MAYMPNTYADNNAGTTTPPVLNLSSCSQKLDKILELQRISLSSKVFKLREILLKSDKNPDNGLTKISTVAYSRTTPEGDIVLNKLKSPLNNTWDSLYSYYNRFSLQGDPRNIFYLLGPELALKFGFKINIHRDGTTELIAPNAEKFGKLIYGINVILKKNGFEPITYLPIKAEYIAPTDGVRFSLQSKGDFEIYFPFADSDPRITVHEVSYHLGSILLPQSITHRAHEITRYTQNFTDYLKTRAHELGELKSEIIDQLLLERSIEIDVGTGNTSHGLALLRQQSGLKDYKFLLGRSVHHYAHDGLNYLIRPNVHPVDAVLLRLYNMTNPLRSEVQKLLLVNDFNFEYKENSEALMGRKIYLTPKQNNILLKIYKDFINSHEPSEFTKQFSITTEEKIMSDLIKSMDERLRQIDKALTELQLVY